jgi:hypothetical protein
MLPDSDKKTAKSQVKRLPTKFPEKSDLESFLGSGLVHREYMSSSDVPFFEDKSLHVSPQNSIMSKYRYESAFINRGETLPPWQ